MTEQWQRHLMVACTVMVASCAGNGALDPGALELRDVLGIAPQAAEAWSATQRTAARRVIEKAMQGTNAPPVRAPAGADATSDSGLAHIVEAVDVDRARHGDGAFGLVRVETIDGAAVVAPRVARFTVPHGPAIELQLAGWTDDPVLAELSTRGASVMPALVLAAGHTSGPVIITPAPRLAAIAAYVPASDAETARLAVNPVALAVLEPTLPGAAGSLLGTIASGPPPGTGSAMPRPSTTQVGSNGDPGWVRALQTGCDATDGCDCSDSSDGTDSGDSGGSCDGCSGDSTDSTDSGGGCSGDSSGDGGGCSDCSGGDGGGCSGDGGDCSGGGGDCSGGDCGGGGDCNAAGPRRGHARSGVATSVAWATLPLVFGTIIKRRNRRDRKRRS